MNSPCDGMFSSLVSLSPLISQQIENYQKNGYNEKKGKTKSKKNK